MFTLIRMLIPPLIAIAIALGIHFGIGSYDNGYWIDQLTKIGIAVILAVSLNIVNGFTGQFSIGHAAFMSIGAYFTGAFLHYASISLYQTRAAIPGILSFTQPFERLKDDAAMFTVQDLYFLLLCIACGLFTAMVGVLVGLPSRRLRGDYLAIVTVGFGEIVRIIISSSDPQIRIASVKGVWGFVEGRKPIEPSFWDMATGLGKASSFNFIPKYGSLFWIWLAVGITVLVAIRLKYSTHGRAYLSIREDETAAEAMGIGTARYKVQAFAISAFFAGIAGALHAASQGTISASEMAFMRSLEIVVIIVLGGLGSVSGALVAAIVLTFLPEFLLWDFANAPSRFRAVLQGDLSLRELVFSSARASENNWIRETVQSYRPIVYALLLILVMLLRPRGLFGNGEIWELLRRRKRVRP